MPVYSGGHGSPRAKRFLFVDAGSFDDAIKEFSSRYFDGIELPINHAALRSIFGTQFDRVFYYDAIHIQRPDETDDEYRNRTAAKRELLASLAEIDGFDVFEGDVRRQRPAAAGQKKVDVAIAVDMLTHTFRQTMDEAALLTSDLDFEPLLRALAQQGMSVTLYHQAKATRELRRAALVRRLLSSRTLWSLLSKDFLTTNPLPNGLGAPSMNSPGPELTSWTGADDSLYALYKAGEGFAVIRRGNTTSHDLMVRADDRARLLLFCEDEFGFEVPAGVGR